MEWSHDGAPNYVNWLYGQPDSTESQYPGNSCGIIDKDSYEDDTNWSALQCNKRANSVCQTLRGKQCPEGWDFVANEGDGKCVNFYKNKPWYEGYQFCKSIGARMFMIESEMEQKALGRFSQRCFQLSL